MERRTVLLPDGRLAEIVLDGPEDGLPLVLHEGTPSGIGLYPPTVAAAAPRGLRVVQIARPGYGGSTPRPGRRVADVAADVAAVLDSLGADTFVTSGASGGGPHALACLALLPGRCLAAACIAGSAPFHAAGLDWLDAMAPENVAEFTAAVTGPEALTSYLYRMAEDLDEVTADQVLSSLGGLVSAADRAAVTSEYAAFLASRMRSAVRSGLTGWREDDLAFVSDWGFTLGWPAPEAAPAPEAVPASPEAPGISDLLRSRPPAAIWHGDQDQMVPFAHGRWLAGNIPGARAHLLKGEGHLSITVTRTGQILDDLLDMAGLTG